MLMRKNKTQNPKSFTHLLGVLCSSLLLSQMASAQTTISQENAVITSDTTWSLAGSPYLLTRDVEVRSQATLTIEPGVEIRFGAVDEASTNNPNGIEIEIQGRLLAMGTSNSPIRINGQDLSGPAANATGIRFEVGAGGSELRYVRINGLSKGVDIRGDMSLLLEGLSVNATHTALSRSTGGSDLVLTEATLVGGEYSADLAGLNENVFTRFIDSELEGALRLRDDGQGAAGFGSELTLDNSNLTGDLNVGGNLQAGASLKILGSTVATGSVIVNGDVNTSSNVIISNTVITALNHRPSLSISGSILSDASVSVSQSILTGSVLLGPTPALAGSGEGQYFFFEGPSTWDDAAASCASLGAKLADAADSAEALSIYNAAKASTSGGAWIGGTIVEPDCSAGDSFVEIADQGTCNSLRTQGIPAQSLTQGKSCSCSLSCSVGTVTRTDCAVNNFACVIDVSYQAQLPTCDARAVNNDLCYGDSQGWTWENGEALDQAAANWGMGEADGLTCLGGSPNLREVLHIAVDTQDPTGGDSGELGLWRAKSGNTALGYVCEGRLAVLATQEVSRGGAHLDEITLNGSLVARVGTMTLSNSSISAKTSVSLYRQGMFHNNHFQGTVSIASRDQVEVSQNQIKQLVQANGTSAGGGLQVESEHATIYGNIIDGGAYGVTSRGSANIANNLITRMTEYGIKSLPDSNTPSGLNNTIANNTLVENEIGVSVEGTINAPTSQVHNNNVVGGSIGMERVGSAPLVPNHNNVFDYDNLYSGFTPDANSRSASPGFVAPYPANPAIFRLDSGSPLIDMGRCDLAPTAPESAGGLRVDIDGIPRPFDGDFDGNSACDIGAFEFGPEEIFMYADGVRANSTSFSTGREVELTLWGRRDSNIFPVSPVVWTIDESVGIFNEATDQFRPASTPGLYEEALHAQFGNLTTSLDVDLACGCVQPDQTNGAPGDCNDVPECYFSDWTCPVRENYCQVAEMGSLQNPLTVAAEDTVQVRPGARDAFGFVFKHNGPFTYSLENGGGSITAGGLFTATSTSGDYLNSLRITSGAVTGVSDIKVIPNDAAEIVISRASQSVSTTRTVLYSAVVKDAFNNVIPEAVVTWSITGAGGATINPETGRVTAGCGFGTFPSAVTATYGNVSRSADLIVDQGGAILTNLAISPSSLTIPATTTDNFSVTVTDACGFTRSANNPVFVSDGNAGSINSSGIFTAGCNLGNFSGTVTVSAESLISSANVTVTSAPLRELSLQPLSAQVRMGASQVFEAIGMDECGRAKVVQPQEWNTPITNGTFSSVGLAVNSQRLSIACSDISAITTHLPDGVRANYTDEFNRTFTAISNVNVLAGEVSTLTVPQSSVSLPAGSDKQLQANAADSCGNPRQDAIRWSTSNGSIGASTGLLTAGCTRGLFPDAVFAQAGGQISQIDIEVTDGVLDRIEITPNPVTVKAGAQKQLNAQLFDGCQNLIDQEPTWRGVEGGSVTPTGLITASEEARTYFGAIIAELGSVQATADLVVTPAAAMTLEVTPDPFIVSAGSVTELEVTAFDTYGNPFSPEVNWTTNPSAGSINEDGDFEAATIVGIFEEGLIARVGSAELSIDVEITPAAVAQLNVQPTPLALNANSSVQLTANPVDAFGNSIAGIPITWSVEAGGGQISSSGLFTAFSQAGTFTDSVIVAGGGIEQKITVQVLPSAAARLALTPNQLSLVPQEEAQLVLMVFDENDNMITPTNVIYSVASGEGHFTVSPSGLVRALQTAGSGSIQVNANGLVALINVDVVAGPVTQIAVTRTIQNETVEVQNTLRVSPSQVVALNAVALDAFENPVNVPLTWSTNVEGFGVNNAGLFTAGTVSGQYQNALRVRHLNVDRLITVQVLAGAPVALHIEPSTIIATPGSSQQLQAYFTDQFGNVSDVEVALRWTREALSNFDITTDGLLEVDCSVTPGFYADQIIVSTAIGTGLALTGTAAVDVRPGEVTAVQLSTDRAMVQVDRDFFIEATGQDACGYPTNDVPRYSIVSGEGSINPEGHFRAGTVTETVVVRGSVGEFSADAEIIITPGEAVDLRVTPDEVSVIVGQRKLFEVEATDEYGNVWTPDEPLWQVRDLNDQHGNESTPSQEGAAGTIDDQGTFRAATTVGTFLSEVKVSFQGQSTFADVYLVPDAPENVEISPQNPEVIPNQILSFRATVSDQYGNLINNVEATFDALPAAGFITESGVFTATDRIGTYPNAIIARVSDGVSSSTNVTINNSAPARIDIDPVTLTATVDSVQRFSAIVYDTEGVEIEDQSVVWSLSDEEIGAIIPEANGDARLSVGMNPGRYFAGIVATITTDDGDVLQGTADLIIPRDFDDDGIDDVIEVRVGLNPEDPDDADVDDDSDGLTNAQEVNIGLDHEDADSDDDGIADGSEESWGADTDGDGLVNALDNDSDGDGIRDGVEVGLENATLSDTDASEFIGDADPVTTTNPLSADTDGDGIDDGDEDANQNGRVDPGETAANSDLNVIACDATLENTGCPEALTCLESICVEPLPETQPEPDDGCNSQGRSKTPLLIFTLLGLIALRRRQLI